MQTHLKVGPPHVDHEERPHLKCVALLHLKSTQFGARDGGEGAIGEISLRCWKGCVPGRCDRRTGPAMGGRGSSRHGTKQRLLKEAQWALCVHGGGRSGI
jgi:hypothetical protein